MVYIKEAEKISDFIKMLNATTSLFYFEDIRIYRDHKNMTNRLNNCEQANVDKSMNASREQLDLIKKLKEIRDFDLLDDKIKDICIYKVYENGNSNCSYFLNEDEATLMTRHPDIKTYLMYVIQLVREYYPKLIDKGIFGYMETGEELSDVINGKYERNDVTNREELLAFIELYSSYKGYTLPVIVSDLSFFNKRDQSLFLKFMDDTDLNLILLASRDNILDTIISRVREFRKFYVDSVNGKISFIAPGKAREMMSSEASETDDISDEDKMLMRNKYNPVLSYDESLVKSFRQSYKDKLLNLLEG